LYFLLDDIFRKSKSDGSIEKLQSFEFLIRSKALLNYANKRKKNRNYLQEKK